MTLRVRRDVGKKSPVSPRRRAFLLSKQRGRATLARVTTMNWYLRFQTPQRALHSSWPLGLFRAANLLRTATFDERVSEPWYEDLFDWFDRELPIPAEGAVDSRAIFWFRADAQTHIAEAWRLTAAYRDVGIWVRPHRTNLPGRIVYRDPFQIAAIPFWPFGRAPPFGIRLATDTQFCQARCKSSDAKGQCNAPHASTHVTVRKTAVSR